jgi:hypothetical protein
MTQDVDLSVVSLAAFRKTEMEPVHVPNILHHADPTLQPINTEGRRTNSAAVLESKWNSSPLPGAAAFQT